MTSLVKRGTDYNSNLLDWFDRSFEDLFYPRVATNNLVAITKETDNEYIIRAEVPGLSHDDIEISYENNILNISATWEEKNDRSIRKGKYSKSYTVYGIDSENINAKLENGILNITLPKSEKLKARKIQIQ